MQTESPHARGRRVHRLELPTPLIAPSFSSRGFPQISAIWEEFRHKLFGVCLVSAFDISGGRIPTSVSDMVNVVILDSGVYETKSGRVNGGEPLTPSSADSWTREHYREAVKGVGGSENLILVNFDHVGSIEDQISGATQDFAFVPQAASDFLVKPAGGAERVNIPKLSDHLEALQQFSVVGITAREVGNSLLQRCSSIVMLRDLLNDAGIDTPIHVFGAINPYEVLAYFFCGSDIFDGLNWLRLAFREGFSIHIDESAMEDMKWNMTDSELSDRAWTQNLGFLCRLQEVLQRYALNGDFEALAKEFPIARQATRVAEIAGAEIRN